MGILDAPPLNKFTAPVYSIRPTGLAAHDVPELAAAVADLPSSGGTILAPRGAQIELGTSTWSFPANKPVHFVGPGQDAATIHYAGTDAGIDLQGSGLGSALSNSLAVRDCVLQGFTIYGPNSTTQAGRGIRLNRTFRCAIRDVRAYGFANNSAPFGAGIYMTSSFYVLVEKYQTWSPDLTTQLYYGLLMDSSQDSTPVFLATIRNSSLYTCARGAGVSGNTVTFQEVGFEHCDLFGATVDVGVNVGFDSCWWEGINNGVAGGTALRLGTSGTANVGSWVRNSRFSSSVYAGIELHGRRCEFKSNVFKPAANGKTPAFPIVEKDVSLGNRFIDNYWDDATGTPLDNSVQSTQQGGAGFGPSITLLAASTSKIVTTGAPKGQLTNAPAVPGTGVAATNNTGRDATVYISGGTVTGVAIGGVTTGITSGMVRVPVGQTITLTYSSAPTWTWFGD